MAEDDFDAGGTDDVAVDETKAKLNEFRSSIRGLRADNRTLVDQIEQLKGELSSRDQKLSTLGDNDPETVKSALQLLNTVEDQAESELIKAGRFDEVIARRLKPREAEYNREKSTLDKQLKEASEREKRAFDMASNMVLESRIREAVKGKKLRPHDTAEADLMMRARQDWKVPEDLEGDLVAANPNNISDDIDAWLDMQVDKAPHLWNGGSGGNARPGAVGADGQRVVKRSELTDREYGALRDDIASGKVKVVR